jgi:serine/threonine protein kinase
MNYYGEVLNLKNLNNDLIYKYIIQLFNGIYFLHKNNISHGDIKPLNILMDNINHIIKIIDYGSVIFNHYEKLNNIKFNYRCTLYYISPEELKNNKYYISNDIWSLGCLLYELFTGKIFIESLFDSINKLYIINLNKFKDIENEEKYDYLKYLFELIKQEDIIHFIDKIENNNFYIYNNDYTYNRFIYILKFIIKKCLIINYKNRINIIEIIDIIEEDNILMKNKSIRESLKEIKYEYNEIKTKEVDMKDKIEYKKLMYYYKDFYEHRNNMIYNIKNIELYKSLYFDIDDERLLYKNIIFPSEKSIFPLGNIDCEIEYDLYVIIKENMYKDIDFFIKCKLSLPLIIYFYDIFNYIIIYEREIEELKQLDERKVIVEDENRCKKQMFNLNKIISFYLGCIIIGNESIKIDNSKYIDKIIDIMTVLPDIMRIFNFKNILNYNYNIKDREIMYDENINDSFLYDILTN